MYNTNLLIRYKFLDIITPDDNKTILHTFDQNKDEIFTNLILDLACTENPLYFPAVASVHK